MIYHIEYSAPSDAGESATVRVTAPPDENRLAHHMVFGHESPITAVGRIVPVVTHHPVVVHLEGILVSLFAVDEYLAVLHLKVVALVSAYRAFIDGNIVQVELDALALCGNPHRSVVVACPVLVAV